ncbi:hypothetical protein ACT7CN_22085 [Bacillus cereus]
MLLDLDFKEKGFTEEDIDEIRSRFLCSIDSLDVEEMMLFENDEAIFKHLYIDDKDKESILETILEMGRVSAETLDDNQTVMDYMVDTGDEDMLKLSSGKWVIFSPELLHKEDLYQMD